MQVSLEWLNEFVELNNAGTGFNILSTIDTPIVVPIDMVYNVEHDFYDGGTIDFLIVNILN